MTSETLEYGQTILYHHWTTLFTASMSFFLSMDVQSQQHTSYAKQLPLFFNGWAGREIEVDKRTLEILETNDVLIRNYTKGADTPVQLCIVYASNNRKVSHPRKYVTRVQDGP